MVVYIMSHILKPSPIVSSTTHCVFSHRFYGVLDLSITLGKTCLQNCTDCWPGWWVLQWLVDGNGFGKAKYLE